MPTNLKSQLKPLVRLKSNESCHALKRHCEDGVLREVIGAWEALLRKYPNEKNFIWPDVDWTVKHTVKGHNKSVGFEARTSHGRWMVEQAYLLAREIGIISRPMEKEIDGVLRRGFILTPHNALCERTKVGCLLVGPYKIPGTSWRSEALFRDGKPTGKRTIVFKGFLQKGTEEGKDVGKEEGTDQGKDQGKDEGKEKSGQQGQGKLIGEVIENGTVVQEFDAISERDSDTYLSSLLVSPNQKDRQYQLTPNADVPFSVFELTDNPKTFGHLLRIDHEASSMEELGGDLAEVKTNTKPAAIVENKSGPAPGLTVGDYFSCGDDVLQVITDGLLSMRNPAIANFKGIDSLRAACWRAVEDASPRQMVDRTTLAMLMGKVMDILDSRRDEVKKYHDSTLLYPKPWLKIREELRQGGEPKYFPIPLAAMRRVAITEDGFPKDLLEGCTKREDAWNRVNAWRCEHNCDDIERFAEIFEKLWQQRSKS